MTDKAKEAETEEATHQLKEEEEEEEEEEQREGQPQQQLQLQHPQPQHLQQRSVLTPDPNWSIDTFNVQDDTELFEEALIPPENFNMVCEHVYRSSFPKKKHYKFLEKLKLKSVLTLILEEYPEQNMKFLKEQNIQFLQFGIAGNKEPFVQIPEDKISAALAAILDKRNHPILIHCNKGKHRTGCLIGCLRKLQNWSHTSIFDEYRRFSHPKSRSMDQQFIELYDAKQVWPLVDRKYLPNWPTLADPFT